MTVTDIQSTRSRKPRYKAAPERELVPRVMVIAVFSLMGLTLSLAAYAQLSGAPKSGVLIEAPVAAEREIRLVGTREGAVTVLDAEGEVIAHSSDDKAGFIGVVWRVLARHRLTAGLPDTAPVRVIRRENGNIAVQDTTTDWSIELIGYGADNVAAFARLVD